MHDAIRPLTQPRSVMNRFVAGLDVGSKVIEEHRRDPLVLGHANVALAVSDVQGDEVVRWPVGAAIYGAEAGAWLDFLTLVINQKMTAADLRSMIFAFPTQTYMLASTLATLLVPVAG